MRKWQGYIDYAFANDIPLVDLMEKAYQMGRTDAKVEYENADIPIIHGKEELELHDSRIRADERTKAIDDFARQLHKRLNEDFVLYPNEIDRIAEQLKEQSNEV